MKILTCRLCHNSDGNIILSVKQTGSKYTEKFDYIKCYKCNSLCINKVPENLAKYYENYYSFKLFETKHSNKFCHSLTRFLLSKHTYLKKLAFFKQHPLDSLAILSLPLSQLSNKAKILDIGSGSGKFVWDLCNLGYKNTSGIDPYIRQDITYKNGAKIAKKELSQLSGVYDLITFHHTFEHLYDLKETLRTVRNFINKKGICLIRIPNIDSFAAREFGVDWTGIHAPYHLNLPSYQAMQVMVEKEGLKIDRLSGEQLPHFFLSNIDNKLNLIHDTNKMFRMFSLSHSKKDFKYWKQKTQLINKSPLLCEWINYYIKLN